MHPWNEISFHSSYTSFPNLVFSEWYRSLKNTRLSGNLLLFPLKKILIEKMIITRQHFVNIKNEMAFFSE
jgi:hypothetical protein